MIGVYRTSPMSTDHTFIRLFATALCHDGDGVSAGNARLSPCWPYDMARDHVDG